MPDDRDILRPLADRIAELAELPAQADRKRLWADHQALRPTPRIPVSVYYEGIPEGTWRKEILGPDYLRCTDPLARRIEGGLRKRIWMAENVPDDHIVWAAVWVGAVATREVGWGVPLERKESGQDRGAWKEVPPLAGEGIDVDRVRFTDQRIDAHATARDVARVREWVGPSLDVHVQYPTLGHSPFDLVVEMRGIEQVMFDAIERPVELSALIERVCDGFVEHHANRERLGQINRHLSRDGAWQIWPMRVHCCDPIPGDGGDTPLLSQEWAYVSAQTSSGLGPAMYGQFVQPANVRMATPFVRRTVYYHGCEPLDAKLDVLAGVPNLRRFHVSPWSDVAKASARFGGRAVLEVHAHPGKVVFGGDEASIRAELVGLIERAGGAPMDLNLSDIHSVDGRPATLGLWARIARELGESPYQGAVVS
ncbi:MAG: hypothetical protein BIFFINMI_00217 [Phycisphaerae bacterium]|nr:hypothetical protein [Phycisphaerae bacterium]